MHKNNWYASADADADALCRMKTAFLHNTNKTMADSKLGN